MRSKGEGRIRAWRGYWLTVTYSEESGSHWKDFWGGGSVKCNLHRVKFPNFFLKEFLYFYHFYYLFIYLFLAVLGLHFSVRAFSSCGKRGPLFIAVHGPLTIAASLVAEHRLQTCRLSSCGSRA